GAAELDPADLLADGAARALAQEAGDVDLDARLGEREEVRAQPDLAVAAEELAGEVLERPLQVGQRQPAVDGEPFDLHEPGRVGGVERVATVAAARADD